jgi:Tfp pilus assembly protein PilW
VIVPSKYYSRKRTCNAGFSLLELMLAISMFVVVGGAAFMLFRQAVPVYTQQQNLAGVNIGVQNAVAQLQQDMVNAGTGYYTGSNIPSWPVGVTIVNQSDTTPCVNGSPYTYTAGCFDTLNVITSDPNCPPQHLAANTNTNTASSLTLYTPSVTTSAQATTLAALYKANDELLIVSSSGLSMATITLTQAGSSAGTTVTLHYNTTNSLANVTAGQALNTVANDPLGITTHTVQADNGSAVFSPGNYGNSDWILRLQPITYKVDVTNAANPVLERVQNGVTNVLAQQIIGFRVGASLWNDVHNTDAQPYNFQSSSFGTGYDFTIVRSVRVSIIGRTTPGSTGMYNYQNSFDGGPYQVMGAAVVVNPRNLSMADSTQ